MEELHVRVEKLDNIIPAGVSIDFIKIDVEGGEFGVLKGARNILMKSKPLLVFECGLGASEFYGTNPADLFSYLQECGYRIFSLQNWLHQKSAYSSEEFIDSFNRNAEYYFVAQTSNDKHIPRQS